MQVLSTAELITLYVPLVQGYLHARICKDV